MAQDLIIYGTLTPLSATTTAPLLTLNSALSQFSGLAQSDSLQLYSNEAASRDFSELAAQPDFRPTCIARG